MDNFDWRMIKLLYEKRSLTKVADALFMTQSALTKRLQGIEKEWHIEMVKRTSKGVVFTVEGQYLAEQSDRVLAILDEVQKHYAAKGQNKEQIKIGVPNSFARLYLSDLISAFNKTGAEIDINTMPNSSDVILQMLIEDALDAGIVCGDYKFSGEKKKLFAEELFLLVPKGLDRKKQAALPLIEGYYNPLVKRIIDQSLKEYFKSKNKKINIVSHIELAISMVESGLGCTPLFGSKWNFAEDKVELIKLYNGKKQPVTRNIWLMWNSEHCKSSKVKDMLQFVVDYYK